MKVLLLAGVAALSLSAMFLPSSAEASAPSAPPACLKCWGYLDVFGCIRFACIAGAPGPGGSSCLILRSPCNWFCTTTNPVCP
ncbi:MAG: hypothetical protein GY711_27735 [bacterium]|nr:hypothetical protein [bacterium]